MKLPTSLLEKATDSLNVVPASGVEIVSFKPVTDGNTSKSVTKNNTQDTVTKSPEISQEPISKQIPTEELNRPPPPIEPKKRAFVDLTEDENEINIWQDSIATKKPKTDDFSYGRNSLDLDCGIKENSNGERYFFPVDPRCEVKDAMGGLIPFIGPSFPVRVRTPNLNLALGAEMEDEEIPSSSCLVGGGGESRMVTKKEAEEEEDVLSSLSLSLSFSGGNKSEDDKRNSSSMLLFRDK